MMAPRISVVVPTRGRPRELSACLAALGRSTLGPDELEVVVVADGEDVDLAALGPDAAGPFPLVQMRRPHAGPAASRNQGARVARAPVVAFTDDDCRPAPEWAERMLARVEARPDALVAGKTLNGLARNRWSSASHLVLEVVIDLYNDRPGELGFAPSCNLAMRREAFLSLGGFDESFRTAAAEDRELCHRLGREGHRVVIEPAAVVEHFHHLDLGAFVGQYAAYGRGEVTYRGVCASRGVRADIVKRGFYRRLFGAALRAKQHPGLAIAGRVFLSQVVFTGAFLAARWGPG